jgi:dTDP-3,4-didehydro-2,6-dideoxy-alpha-D-glucose 3-reductase
MDILIVGHSSLAQRKVIPALVKLDEVEKIHIASRGPVPQEALPITKRGEFFTGYDAALKELKPCLAYISLPNSLHAKWARNAMERGFHVAIDKPSVMKTDDAAKLYQLSRTRGVALAEVNVWHYHPMAKRLRALYSKEDSLSVAQLIFTNPPLNPEDFRYVRKLGGGILRDRASYAISCGRILLNGKPEDISVYTTTRDKNGLDLSVSLQMQYGSTALQAAFSFEGEYTNELTLVGKRFFARVPQIFTPPSNIKGEIQLRRQNISETIRTGSCDTFGAFFSDFIQKIETGQASTFGADLLSDALVFQQLLDAERDFYAH